MPVRSAQTWYAGGLCFECTRCGNCCSGPDEGYVWVTVEEIEAIARHLALDADEFGRRYLRLVEGGYSLIEKPNKDCVFFEPERGCSIYEVRPVQCRTFPFWGEHIASKRAWKDIGQACPGVGQGRRYTEREIKDRVTRTEDGRPE